MIHQKKPKKENLTGLWEHRWNCIQCEKSWFLSVDLAKDRDKIRLQKFYDAVSIHCMNLKHEVVHKQKQMKFSMRF